jgi:hypothetical protein
LRGIFAHPPVDFLVGCAGLNEFLELHGVESGELPKRQPRGRRD